MLSFDLLATTETGKRVMTELALGGTMRLFRYRGDERAIVGYAKPAHAGAYDRMFGARVCFDQAQTSFELSSSALERQHVLSNEGRFQSIREHAAGLRQRGA